jgi:hypothetical protein
MVFIFTEMIRCGNIGYHAILSYFKHHSHPLHIFLGEDDVQFIPIDLRITLHIIDKNSPTFKGFDQGHLGTSMLWRDIFLENHNEKIIHFDSDVYFTGNIIDDIIEKLEDNDLVGSFRPYKLNPNNMDHVRQYPDCIQTYCVGINTSKTTITNPDDLQNMIRGYLWKHPVIDYFDPVTFHMRENGARIVYLDIDVIGGVDQLGKRNNKYSLNEFFDVGSKIIHFAGVGSGRNFYNMKVENKSPDVPNTYVDWAVERYDFYLRLFYNKYILSNPSCNIATFRSLLGEEFQFKDEPTKFDNKDIGISSNQLFTR